MLLACRCQRKIQEAGDRLEMIVGDYAKVDATGQCWTALRPEFSGEADTVMVCVDLIGPTEAVSGALRLDGLDHRVDARMA